MSTDTIVIYLKWCGSRQAVSVRPIGLSCVEAVKEWVASLRQSSEPFEIVGLKNAVTGDTIWATQLPENLDLGIPQNLLQHGAEYEVIVGAAPRQVVTSNPPPVRAPIHVGAPTVLPPIYVEPAWAGRTTIFSPAKAQGIYPVSHPWEATNLPVGLNVGNTLKEITNVYYLDEFGNRISGPEAVTGMPFPYSPSRMSRSPEWKGHASAHPRELPQRTRSAGRSSSGSPHRLQRSASTGDLWDRLAAPRNPRQPSSPQSARKPAYRSEAERQEAIERLLTPRNNYEREDDSDFDPNLRTVYRKMTPEDLDMFVYRMYAPHKHSAPRRDIYDESMQAKKRANTFREEVPENKPPMDFRLRSPALDEVYDDDSFREHHQLTEGEREEVFKRVHEAGMKQRERQAQRIAQKENQERLAAHPDIGPKTEVGQGRDKKLWERLSAKPKEPPKPELPPFTPVGLTHHGGKKGQPLKVNTRELIKRLDKKKEVKEPELPPEFKKDVVHFDYKDGRPRKDKINVNELNKRFHDLYTTPGGRQKAWLERHPIEEKKKATDNKKPENSWRNVW